MEQYNNIQQAYKKNPGEERKPVSFTTPIQAVYDGKTGASLEAILAQFNSIYVQYQGTQRDTRLIIPKEMRRAGLTITYMDMESNTITERANSAVQKDNDHWALDVNWSRVDELSLSGDISVSAAGTWIINGKDTGVKALGPKGDSGLTPWLKTIENRLHFSYDNITWEPCSENIAAWFRWSGNKIQISRDNKTWTDLSGKFADNIHIKGYVASTAALPSGAAQGDIYGVGPTYAAEDTAHSNPIYRYYVRNANTWVDNGSFTSLSAGVVQETGNSETEVMSQKAVSEKLSELGSKVEMLDDRLFIKYEEYVNLNKSAEQGSSTIQLYSIDKILQQGRYRFTIKRTDSSTASAALSAVYASTEEEIGSLNIAENTTSFVYEVKEECGTLRLWCNSPMSYNIIVENVVYMDVIEELGKKINDIPKIEMEVDSIEAKLSFKYEEYVSLDKSASQGRNFIELSKIDKYLQPGVYRFTINRTDSSTNAAELIVIYASSRETVGTLGSDETSASFIFNVEETVGTMELFCNTSPMSYNFVVEAKVKTDVIDELLRKTKDVSQLEKDITDVIDKTSDEIYNRNGTAEEGVNNNIEIYKEPLAILEKSASYIITLSRIDDSLCNAELLAEYADKIVSLGVLKEGNSILKINFTPKDELGLLLLYCDTSSMNYNITIKRTDLDAVKTEKDYIIVSASNSDMRMKLISDFVCTGENDEITIQKAIDTAVAKNISGVKFANGLYNIQSFPNTDAEGNPCAIILKYNWREVELAGCNCSYGFTKDFRNGVIFYVDDIGYSSVSDKVSLISTNKRLSITSGIGLKINNIGFVSYGSQKPITMLNLTGVDRIYADKLMFIGYGNELLNDSSIGLSKVPVAIPKENFVAVKMGTGSNDPQGYQFNNVGIWGFYEGFKAGGEHLIMIGCSSTLCVYGWTFGNYDWANPNSIVHPITLINCCDERNQYMMQLVNCGFHQEITMINHNIECVPSQTPGGVVLGKMRANENFCGEITFTVMTEWSNGESGGNRKDFNIWDEGQGHNIRTVNATHKQAGTTAERKTYAPNYMQLYFDTDINKQLVYIGTKWVDVLGQEVD